MGEKQTRFWPTTLTISTLSLFAAVVVAIFPLTKHGSSPELPPYTTDWLGGGQTADSICLPAREKYAIQHPDFDVGVKSLEASTRNSLGQTQYKYTCFFSARNKGETAETAEKSPGELSSKIANWIESIRHRLGFD
jgi:hypothetical protein